MLLKSVFVFVTLFAFSLASEVLEIGDDDFNTKVAETDTTLVMFYAPWYVFRFRLIKKSFIKLLFVCITMDVAIFIVIPKRRKKEKKKHVVLTLDSWYGCDECTKVP